MSRISSIEQANVIAKYTILKQDSKDFKPFSFFQFGSFEWEDAPLNSLVQEMNVFETKESSDDDKDSPKNFMGLKIDSLDSQTDGPKLKGRKRKFNSNPKSIRSIIESEAVTKWVYYLKKKIDSSEARESGLAPRDDTIWKKIFRDWREFYRILFKLRFHPLDYKSPKEADKCTIIILKELGIETGHLEPYEIRKYFYFLHQTRLNSSDHYKSEFGEIETAIWATDIIEKYKDSYKALFLVDPIWSKLFYILYYNFDYVYFHFLKAKYRGRIDVVIKQLISWYTEIAAKEDILNLIPTIF